MFELNEAVRGCLIGLKSWDRIVIIFGTSNGQPCSSRTVCDGYDGNDVLNGALVCIGLVMTVKFGFTK